MDIEPIIRKYNTDESIIPMEPRETYSDYQILMGRLYRAANDQIESDPATVSRYANWAGAW